MIGPTQVIFICTEHIMMFGQQYPVCMLLLFWDFEVGMGKKFFLLFP
jgi:hypothetical protein